MALQIPIGANTMTFFSLPVASGLADSPARPSV